METDERTLDAVEAGSTSASGIAKQPPSPKPIIPISTYIAKRLDPQIAWFEARSGKAKQRHLGVVSTQLLATSSIPVVNALTGSTTASTVLAFLAALATGFSAFGRHHEHWIRYRSTASALQTLRLHHELGLGPFGDADGDQHLIEEVEKLLAGEQEDWASNVRNTASDKSAKASKS